MSMVWSRHKRRYSGVTPYVVGWWVFCLVWCEINEGFAQQETPVVFAIKHEVEIPHDVITLRDVLEGEDVNRFAEVVLAPTPKPGYARTIPVSLIISKLRRWGYSEEQIAFDDGKDVVVKRATLVVPKEFIAESLRRYILNNMPWEESATTVQVFPPADDLYCSDGDIEIRWKPAGAYRFLGTGIFRGAVWVNDKEVKTILCKAMIETHSVALVAVRDIQKGKIITEQDVGYKEVKLDNKKVSAVWDITSIVGMEAKKSIREGSIIQIDDVVPPIVVKKNQVLSVEYTDDKISIVAKARALMDGRIGERIRCVYLNSEQPIEGVLTADGIIKLE